MTTTSRYTRQILIFGEEGQKKIEGVQVGIVGLGGIGSQIAQGLAYLGVLSYILIDDDHIDESNLNRTVGAFSQDAKTKALKVDIAKRHIQKINPEATVLTIPKNLRSREALEALISCPIIFGCVDRDGPRLVLMELAAAYEIILIDSATEVFIEEDGNIFEFGGRVVVARPGDFCLSCANQIDMEAAKQELESPAIRELRETHGYGLGNEIKAPSVISLNAVVANLAITEFMVLTTGIRAPHRHLTYYGLRGKMNVRQDQYRDDCYICGYLVGSREQVNIFRYVNIT